MRIVSEMSAADVARARWQELVGREFPAGAVVASLVTIATFAPLLAAIAKTSMIAWVAIFPLCAAGIGVGIRRLAVAVTARYGIVACFATMVCGLISLWLFSCGTHAVVSDFWATSPAQCFVGVLPDLPIVAAGFAFAAVVAFFTGFRQLRVSELLPQKR